MRRNRGKLNLAVRFAEIKNISMDTTIINMEVINTEIISMKMINTISNMRII